MALAVEHEKRRKKILEKALDVFMDDGFENATFQKIADKSGITRTILYLYFKNKREIFNFSIKQFLANAEEKLNEIRSNDKMNSIEKITKILSAVFKLLDHNRKLLSVVLDYLLHTSKDDFNPDERVRRRTLKLRRIISSVLIEGVKAGEIKNVNIKEANDYLYSYVESAIFQLAVLKRKEIKELEKTTLFAVKQLVV